MVAGALFAGSTQNAKAEEQDTPPSQKWSFAGPFGKYDRGALQRGLKIYKEVCSNCHALSYIAFRNLGDPGGPGYTPAQVAAFASEYKIKDGPNDQGDMFERPGRAADYFPSPFPNDQAARVANGGGLPPDLSLITKAVHLRLLHPVPGTWPELCRSDFAGLSKEAGWHHAAGGHLLQQVFPRPCHQDAAAADQGAGDL
jgi:cytochrome c1